MAIIIRCRSLNRFVVTDVKLGSDESISFNSLVKLLSSIYQFSEIKAKEIVNLARINPAIFVDDDGEFKLIENKQKKFNANGLFQRMFNDMAGTNNVEAYCNRNNQIAVKDFIMSPAEMNAIQRFKK